jgi:hypothetical protein
MILSRKSSQNIILLLASLLPIACSDKSDFSERYRGEDPFYVSEPESQTNETDDPGSLRLKRQRFEQSKKTNLDVLWVIDNSASMSPYQEQLASNIDAFLQAASDWNADIQMGVTSTDMCEAVRPSDPDKIMCPDRAQTVAGLRGRLAGNRIIRGMGEDARSEFFRLARLGTSGSSFEHGLTAAKSAVEASLTGDNFGLVRDNSFLSVVIVSDEEDDGVGLSKKDEAGRNWWAEGATRYKFTSENLIEFLRRVRPDGAFSVSSVVGLSRRQGLDSPCGADGTLEVGAEQLKASQMSGGFTLDICESDWAAGLQAMADDFSAQVSSFKLLAVPQDPRSIILKVDGLVIESGWRYIDSRQAIVFDADKVPDFGSVVEVEYY